MASTIKTKIKKGEGIRKEKRLLPVRELQREVYPGKSTSPIRKEGSRPSLGQTRTLDKVGQRPPESDEKYGRPGPSR